MSFKISWVDAGREPQCKPDPAYPHGQDVDATLLPGPACETTLPYPAKRCGYYVVTCETCGLSIAVTTAGRPDDPRSLRVSCRGRDRLQ